MLFIIVDKISFAVHVKQGFNGPRFIHLSNRVWLATIICCWCSCHWYKNIKYCNYKYTNNFLQHWGREDDVQVFMGMPKCECQKMQVFTYCVFFLTHGVVTLEKKLPFHCEWGFLIWFFSVIVFSDCVFLLTGCVCLCFPLLAMSPAALPHCTNVTATAAVATGAQITERASFGSRKREAGGPVSGCPPKVALSRQQFGLLQHRPK